MVILVVEEADLTLSWASHSELGGLGNHLVDTDWIEAQCLIRFVCFVVPYSLGGHSAAEYIVPNTFLHSAQCPRQETA